MLESAASGLWLITRAQPGAAATAERLAARGVETILSPVLVVAPIPEADLDPREAHALAFTSAAGVSAFAGLRPERGLPAYTVGAATAQAARAAGFTDVRSADGNVATLSARLIADRADRVMHVSGEDQAGDLAGTLRAAGLRAWRRIAYRAAAAQSLTPEAVNAISDARLAGVLFHSPRGAARFARLLPQAMAAKLCSVTAACLSPAVAEAAGALPWAKVAIAAHPDEDAILALARPTAAEA